LWKNINQNIHQTLKEIQQNDFIDADSFLKLIQKDAVSLYFSDFDLKNAQYRPLDLLFSMRNGLAEKYNKEEMEQMLLSNHGKHAELIRNEKEHTYEVTKKEHAEQQKEEKKILDTS
jgi:hypothetical protein